jgi:daunorubicin resistance ABC transporter ATP-binding subunit
MADAAIRVEGLTKRFGNVAALDGIDFEVPPGSVFGLLGPNGAGKTTAVRVLATILRPDGGHAEVMGYDVVRQATAVRFQIGLAGQSAAVDANLTGAENLRLIGRLAQMRRRDVAPRADELLARFDLSDAADRPVRTYSGGMRRRLDVAAALVARPPVLFLDEPTTGLDIQSRTELWAVIRELVAEGATVLLTTQYLEEADRLADRIAVVDHGRIVANDTSTALKAQLAGTVIEIGMETEERAGRAHELLVRAVADHPQRDGVTVRLTSNEGPSALIETLRLLDANSLTPATLTVREPRLDDAFLALTGRRAESGDGEAGDARTDGAHIDGDATGSDGGGGEAGGGGGEAVAASAEPPSASQRARRAA